MALRLCGPVACCYKALLRITLYSGAVTKTGDLKVSARGQMSLPAAARHRWGLEEGGAVGYLDLGDAVLVVPGGVEQARRELMEAVSAEDWAQARLGFGDSDLANG